MNHQERNNQFIHQGDTRNISKIQSLKNHEITYFSHGRIIKLEEVLLTMK